eukprot:1186348-Prorocentrum_minimum.AAC.2
MQQSALIQRPKYRRRKIRHAQSRSASVADLAAPVLGSLDERRHDSAPPCGSSHDHRTLDTDIRRP